MNLLRGMFLTSLLLSSSLLSCVLAATPTIERHMEIIEATIEGGSIATVDPAAIYDTASAAILARAWISYYYLGNATRRRVRTY